MRGCHVTSVSHYTVLPPKTIHTKSKFLNFEKKKKKAKKNKTKQRKTKKQQKKSRFHKTSECSNK